MFMNVIECLRVVREHSRTFEVINDVRRRSKTFRDVQKMTIWLSDIVYVKRKKKFFLSLNVHGIQMKKLCTFVFLCYIKEYNLIFSLDISVYFKIGFAYFLSYIRRPNVSFFRKNILKIFL